MKKETAERVSKLWADMSRLEREKTEIIKATCLTALKFLIHNERGEDIEYPIFLSPDEEQKIRQYIINVFEEIIKGYEKELENLL